MNDLYICIIVARFPPDIGGVENQAYHLALQLLSQGCKVEVLAQKSEVACKRFTLYNGIPVHRLGFPIGKSWSSLSYILAALLRIGRMKPALIHAYMLSSPSVIAALSGIIWNIPSLAYVSGLGQIGEIGMAKKSWFRLAKIMFLRNCLDIIIAQAQIMRREVVDAGFPEKKLKVITNGVDTEIFVPVENAIKKAIRAELGLQDTIVVIYTGRFSYEKGVDILLDAWAGMENNEKAVLVLVGDGPERENLEYKAPTNVIFTGYVEKPEKYLQAADIFVLPSREEAMPVSLLQAMSCGLPCLVTGVGAIPEIVVNNDDALVIESSNAGAIRENLCKLMNNPEIRTALGENARRKADKRYSIKTVAEEYVKTYKDLLAKT